MSTGRIDLLGLRDLHIHLTNLEPVEEARRDNRANAWACWLDCLRLYGLGAPLNILRQQGVIPQALVTGPGYQAFVEQQEGDRAEQLLRATAASIRQVAEAISSLRRRQSVLNHRSPHVAKAAVYLFLLYTRDLANPRRRSRQEPAAVQE